MGRDRGVIGILAVAGIFVVAALHYKTATDVTTALSPTVGVIAALVGAYFGIRGATVAQGQAIEMMQQAQKGVGRPATGSDAEANPQ